MRIPAVGCITVAALLLGCQFSDRPEIGEVEGTVYLDGEPLDGAIVYFSPEGGGRVSQAMTDAQGHYDLVYIGKDLGAKTGTHKVRITTAYEITDEKTGKPVYKPERVPSRYHSEQTELTAEVEGSDNTIDFQLLSK
jgi:hypothetical protein